MSVVYAAHDMSVVWSQGVSQIARGDVWDADAELVKERPDLFSATPTRVRGVVNRAPVAEPADEPADKADSADKPAPRKRAK